MAMLERDVKMVQMTLDKTTRRFGVRLVVAGYLDSLSDQEKRERIMEEIFQTIQEWCPEDYDVERINFSEYCCQIGVGDPVKNFYGVTWEEDYEVVIYIDGSTQLLERGFGVEDQRAETGFVVVVSSQSPVLAELRVLNTKKGSCRGRASNFDTEVAAIVESVKWSQHNRVKDTLIRSDSMDRG